jgi:hypothetical protein
MAITEKDSTKHDGKKHPKPVRNKPVTPRYCLIRETLSDIRKKVKKDQRHVLQKGAGAAGRYSSKIGYQSKFTGYRRSLDG